MCGIIGYVGYRQAMPILLESLGTQEYRGYDSAGVALIEDGEIRLVRAPGKLKELTNKIGDDYGAATVGIGHTRWATHGVPSEVNAHPHLDCKGEIAVLHNGIIENYLELRAWLRERGHVFHSETDTEVLPHLLEHYYEGDLLNAMQQTVQRLRGAYATVAVCKNDPRRLVAARQDNPLIIGLGEGECFFASDMAGLINYTRRMIALVNGDVAEISDGGVTIYNNGQLVEREVVYVDWDKETAQKGGYPYYMIKEIHEQPVSLRQTLKGRLAEDGSAIVLTELDELADGYLTGLKKIAVVACGTAYHAGLVGKYAMEKLLRLPVDVDVASEFRYRDPLVDENTLVIVVSQSGETADTLAALRESKKRGAKVLAVCNVVASSIAREADLVLYTYAGPEIAVASTKAYSTQIMLMYMLTLYLAGRLGRLTAAERQRLIGELCALPDKVQQILDQSGEQITEIAHRLFHMQQDTAFFIGRGIDHYVALEGSLKLKEISYIHAEAYAAGELKHGTIALIVPDVPVLALLTQGALTEKMISNIKELQARHAYVVGVALDGSSTAAAVCEEMIYLPPTDDLLAPVLAVVPLQLMAYYAALSRGCDVDQPRNLAKSVTVE